MNRPRWALNRALLLVLAALIAYQAISLFTRTRGFTDTSIYAEAIQRVVRGGEPLYGQEYRTLTDQRPERLTWDRSSEYELFFYPPASIPLFVWMAYGTELTNFRLVLLAQYAGLLLCLLMLRRMFGPWNAGEAGGEARVDFLIAGAAAFASAPFLHGNVVGNVNVLALTSAVAFICLLDSRPTLAGSALAIGAVIKVYPALLLLFAITLRKWRAVGAFAATGGALIALSCAFVTVTEQWYFLSELMPWMSNYFDSRLATQSLHGALDRLIRWPEGTGLYGDLVRIPSSWRASISCVSVVFVGIVIALAWRRRSVVATQRLMLILLASVPLLSPKGHVHVHVFALPLLIDCFMRLRTQPLGRGLCVAAIFAIVPPIWTGLSLVHQLPIWAEQIWYSRFALVTISGILWALWDVSERHGDAVAATIASPWSPPTRPTAPRHAPSRPAPRPPATYLGSRSRWRRKRVPC